MNTITRVFDIPFYQKENYRNSTAFVCKKTNTWVPTSTEQYIEHSEYMSCAFLKMGINKGDSIAIISSNRTAWNITDMAMLQIGAISVPVYPTVAAETYEYIFEHAEVKLCVVENQELYDKISPVLHRMPHIVVVSIDPVEGCTLWQDVLEDGKQHHDKNKLEEVRNNVDENDIATIIYTSGTTGEPKGVVLTHKNIVSNVLNTSIVVKKCQPTLLPGDHVLSFLPVSHSFERIVLYVTQYLGLSIYFAQTMESIAADSRDIKPHLMVVVPRLIEKVHDAIMTKGGSLGGIKKSLFNWAVSLVHKYEPYKATSVGYRLQLKIADALILNKWRAALGGRLKFMVSGSAALRPLLIRFFSGAGIPVLEGYGLSETSPVVSVNCLTPSHFKLGSVGKPIPKVEVKFGEDREILIKGANVMQGYHKNQELTNKTINQNGYLHTGDIGRMDEEGFLYITDRKKLMFKTTWGKYIAPQRIEGMLKGSKFIEHVVILGEGKKYVAALIQPNFIYLKQWSIDNNLPLEHADDMIKAPTLLDAIEKDIEKVSSSLGKWEKIKKFSLVSDAWSIENGELTPTLKVKQRVIEERYESIIEELFTES